MTFEAIISHKAWRDLVAICDQIALTSPRAAARFVEGVQSAMSDLARFPRLGRARPELALSAVRSRAVPGFPHHMLLYCVVADRIVILRILDGRRDLPHLFDEL